MYRELRSCCRREHRCDANMGRSAERCSAQAGDTRFFRNTSRGAGWDEWHCMTSSHNMSTLQSKEGKPPTQEPELLPSSAMSPLSLQAKLTSCFTANKKITTELCGLSEQVVKGAEGDTLITGSP